MKKKLLLVILILFSFVAVSNAQLIESFDAVVGDSTYQNNVESGSVMTTSAVTTDIIEGTGALQINATIASLHDWGSYAQLIKRVPVGQPYLDWSVSDTLKLW